MLAERFASSIRKCLASLQPKFSFLCRVADVDFASIVTACEPGAIQELDKRHATEAEPVPCVTPMQPHIAHDAHVVVARVKRSVCTGASEEVVVVEGDSAAIVPDGSTSTPGRERSAKKEKNRARFHGVLQVYPPSHKASADLRPPFVGLRKICLEIAGFFVLRQERHETQGA